MKKHIIRIVMCCIALLVVGLTAILPITKNLTRIGPRNLVAHAESVSSYNVYTGSRFMLTSPVYSARSTANMYTSNIPASIELEMSFYKDPATNNIRIKPLIYYVSNTSAGVVMDYGDYVDPDEMRPDYYFTYTTGTLVWFHNYRYNLATAGYPSPSYFNIWVEVSGSFDCNPRRIVMASSHSGGLIDSSIRYYDANNNYLHVSLYTGFYGTGVFSGVTNPNDSFLNYYGLNARTYYLIDDYTDTDIYQNGFSQGYNDGYSQGESNGYGNGYSAGDLNGYNRGYQDGANSANTYTFTSLMGSVIDVPVQTFTSLFHFEILGVYLDGFFLGLLTLCVIVTIVKLIL